MIFALALAFGFAIAIARGGRLAAISAVRFRRGWLFVAAFGLQMAVVYLPWLQSGGRYQLPAVLIGLSYLMLVAGVIANHRLAGMKLLGLGLLLNLAVIVANGGFMPITPAAASEMGLVTPGMDFEPGMRVDRSKDILLETDNTNLWVLSDIFLPGRYLPIKTVFSIGDAVSAIGLFLAIQGLMLPARVVRGERLPRAASGVS